MLEIGTGSGYQTALLSVLASQVFSIERIPALLDSAREAVRKVGARNISFLLGDGTLWVAAVRAVQCYPGRRRRA